jgi:class 3 adenylate cyclase
MSRLLAAAFRIGSDPGDDEDLRLRKLLAISAVLMVTPAGLVWGAIYWWFDQPSAAALPWAYAALATVSISLFRVNRNYPLFVGTQLIAFLILPFALMWVLGGFITGSAVALWAWVSPLAARLVGHRRAAIGLLLAFIGGFVISAVISPPPSDEALPDLVVVAFFVLNVGATAGVTFALVDAASGGREGSLASMRGMVRRYFSADVVATILADPSRQELGGEVTDATILFADLGGYTTYAGSRAPAEVVGLVNAYFGTAVPAIEAEGGTTISLPGDAVLAVFGAPTPQADHALRAARAALAIQAAGRALARSHPDWPSFRIGLNSGEVLVGNIGSADYRQFTAMGDTVNMAQRFQSLAEPGQIVIGPRTASELGAAAEATSLGPVLVKGKSEPVEPWELRGVRVA